MTVTRTRPNHIIGIACRHCDTKMKLAPAEDNIYTLVWHCPSCKNYFDYATHTAKVDFIPEKHHKYIMRWNHS